MTWFSSLKTRKVRGRMIAKGKEGKGKINGNSTVEGRVKRSESVFGEESLSHEKM